MYVEGLVERYDLFHFILQLYNCSVWGIFITSLKFIARSRKQNKTKLISVTYEAENIPMGH